MDFKKHVFGFAKENFHIQDQMSYIDCDNETGDMILKSTLGDKAEELRVNVTSGQCILTSKSMEVENYSYAWQMYIISKTFGEDRKNLINQYIESAILNISRCFEGEMLDQLKSGKISKEELVAKFNRDAEHLTDLEGKNFVILISSLESKETIINKLRFNRDRYVECYGKLMSLLCEKFGERTYNQDGEPVWELEPPASEIYIELQEIQESFDFLFRYYLQEVAKVFDR